MRPRIANQETETIKVRRLSDGEFCVIEKVQMDSEKYELVKPVVPSAGITLKKRANLKAS